MQWIINSQWFYYIMLWVTWFVFIVIFSYLSTDIFVWHYGYWTWIAIVSIYRLIKFLWYKKNQSQFKKISIFQIQKNKKIVYSVVDWLLISIVFSICIISHYENKETNVVWFLIFLMIVLIALKIYVLYDKNKEIASS